MKGVYPFVLIRRFFKRGNLSENVIAHTDAKNERAL